MKDKVINKNTLAKMQDIINKKKGGFSNQFLVDKIKEVKNELAHFDKLEMPKKVSVYEVESVEDANVRLAKNFLLYVNTLLDGFVDDSVTVMQKHDKMGRPKLTMQDLYKKQYKNKALLAALNQKVSKGVDNLVAA